MGFFNEKWIEAMKSGKFICSVCGELMFFENEWEEVLICPRCGHECLTDRYGIEDDDKYYALYPTIEELTGEYEEDDEDDDSGERYEDVHGELDDK